MILNGIMGKNYVPMLKINGGGEGDIYLLQENQNYVAKIFKPECRNAAREEKLRQMVRVKFTEEQLKQIIWPLDVLYEKNQFVGFVMPKLSDVHTLTALYADGDYDYRFRVLAALNLCIAMKTVHDAGQICGDMNPQNICINLNSEDKANGFQVSLVDADSYHFVAEDKIYRCEVGVAEFLSPELIKKLASSDENLKNIALPTFTIESDRFALAIHIFVLLMNGCHPFACAKGGTVSRIEIRRGKVRKYPIEAPQPVDNMKDGFFPFVQHRPGIIHPLYAPDFESLSEELQRLFIRAFVDGYTDPTKRPTEAEWIEALKYSEMTNRNCQEKDLSKRHYYFSNNTECPMCMVKRRISDQMKRRI